jgi:hypothetical protein
VITTKIIELAIAGECNPDVLAEKALKDIRGPVGSRQLPPHAAPPVPPGS